jgi:hypothetical protein
VLGAFFQDVRAPFQLLMTFVIHTDLMLNFMLVTAIYLLVSKHSRILIKKNHQDSGVVISLFIPQVSYRVFVSDVLKSAFIPNGDNNRQYQNFVAGIIISVCLYFSLVILLKIPVL